jgi:hypothetical protein
VVRCDSLGQLLKGQGFFDQARVFDRRAEVFQQRIYRLRIELALLHQIFPHRGVGRKQRTEAHPQVLEG